MLKQQLFTIYVFLKNLIFPCFCDEKQNTFQENKGNQSIKIYRVGKLSPIISESSGLIATNENSIWTINDSDGPTTLYKINLKGNLTDSLSIPSIQNIDWEALATDNLGNIYIGDIGNNRHNRDDLVIYKIAKNKVEPEKIFIHFSTHQSTETTNIYSPDTEAIVWSNDSLYLFTKHWKEKTVKLYSLPAKSGHQLAELKDSIYISSPVTDAALSADLSQLALLTYGKIFLFDISNGIDLSKPLRCIRFPRSGQAEGITSIEPDTWYISNENRKLFWLKMRDGN